MHNFVIMLEISVFKNLTSYLLQTLDLRGLTCCFD